MPEPVVAPSEPTRWQRLTVAGIGLVLVAHTVLLALWLAPSSPLRDAVGNTRLATYVDPYFRQGDETVGIGSNRVDESLSLRAYLRPEGGGEPSFTAWIDVTADENAAVVGQVDSGRSHQVARRLATNLNFALFALTPQQRAVAADAVADQSDAQLQRSLLSADGADRDDVDNFVANAQMATQYASLWLGARFPDAELLQVQYRVGRRSVPDVGERRPAALGGVEFDYFGVGWRRAFRADPEARAAFEQYVESARE